MAMNASALATDIEGRFAALYPGLSSEDRNAALTALCDAIVDHIQNFAVVTCNPGTFEANGHPVVGQGVGTVA